MGLILELKNPTWREPPAIMNVSCYVKCLVYKTGESINDYFWLEVIADASHNLIAEDWAQQCIEEDLEEKLEEVLADKEGSIWSVFLQLDISSYIHRTDCGDEHDVDIDIMKSTVRAPKNFAELREWYTYLIKPEIPNTESVPSAPIDASIAPVS